MVLHGRGQSRDMQRFNRSEERRDSSDRAARQLSGDAHAMPGRSPSAACRLLRSRQKRAMAYAVWPRGHNEHLVPSYVADTVRPSFGSLGIVPPSTVAPPSRGDPRQKPRACSPRHPAVRRGPRSARYRRISMIKPARRTPPPVREWLQPIATTRRQVLLPPVQSKSWQEAKFEDQPGHPFAKALLTNELMEDVWVLIANWPGSLDLV
jgi:hypothetical protein